jgi:hypothetical protein
VRDACGASAPPETGNGRSINTQGFRIRRSLSDGTDRQKTMQCPSCRLDLTDDAPIHRVSLLWRHTYWVVRHVCGDCASHLGKSHRWHSPMSCEGCGRPMIHDTDCRPPLHVICGEACNRAIKAAVARDRH